MERMLDGLVDPIGEAADASDAEDESHCAEALKPSGICKRKMVFILYGAKKKLADHSKDVDCCDYD